MLSHLDIERPVLNCIHIVFLEFRFFFISGLSGAEGCFMISEGQSLSDFLRKYGPVAHSVVIRADTLVIPQLS